jgi:hypothetical protein
MTEAMERLLERLQTGWAPRADEIDPSIQQQDLIDWRFVVASLSGRLMLFGTVDQSDGWRDLTYEVLWIDEHLTWALCEDGFWWLYTAEEGEKMRYLGG